MMRAPDILCIGSVLWDVIGRHPHDMALGDDRPGRIRRIPGGVALNIAMTLVQFGLRPALLSALGDDAEGAELSAACDAMGLDTSFLHIAMGMRTDVYMAVEAQNGLIAAIADAHTLEAAGDAILASLADGRLGTAAAPYKGAIALDGNLTEALLTDIADSPLFAAADLRIAPASPGKATRLLPLLTHAGATIYVNKEEAGLLCGTTFSTAAKGAEALLAKGATRVSVTDGGLPAALGTAQDGILSVAPPAVSVTRVTGAGDTFMAAHIAAELAGKPPQSALSAALTAAARFVSGETPA